MKKKLQQTILLTLAVFFVFACLLPLGIRPMIRPDEFRYAEIPREMIASGNWTVPRLNGMRYFEKPVLGYQLTALSFKLFGENTFALRLPSLLAMLVTGIFLYLLMRRKSRNVFVPGLAAGIWFTMGIVYGIGTYAVPDMPLTCALTLTIGGFWLACQSETRKEKVLWLILAGAACGAAFLLKGFLALAVPAAAIIPFLIWKRDWKAFLIYPWIPLAAALIVALPWSLRIAQLEPDFWRYFFMEEHVNRFLGHTYDRRPQPFWYYLPVLLGGVLPAGLLWFSAFRGAGKNFIRDDRVQFMLCWAVFPFVMFSISSCKLGGYILPCFPAIAALTAVSFRNAMRHSKFQTGFIHLTKCWGWFWMLSAVAGALFLILKPGLYKFILLPLLIFVFVYGLVVFVKTAKTMRTLQFVLLGMIPILMLAPATLPVRLFKNKMPQSGLEKCLKELPIGPDDIVLTERSSTVAAAWLLKRSDLMVLSHPGELGYSYRNYPEYKDRFDPEGTRIPELLKTGRKVFLIQFSKLKGGAKLPDWPGQKSVSADGVRIIQYERLPIP